MTDANPFVWEKRFPSWMAEKFSPHRLTPPLPVDRCVDALTGRVKPRDVWDQDPDVFHLDRASSASVGAQFELMKHQEVVRAFFGTEDSRSPLLYRGLYLIHGLGSGKSCSAIAVAEALKHKRNIVVLTPASLRLNFLQELNKCGDPLYRSGQSGGASGKGSGGNTAIDRRFTFLHFDAPDILQRLDDLPDGLDQKLVIIDEAHNVINMMCTGSTKGVALYERLMEATNMRLLLLSGTPMINDPFELGIAANLLRGYMTKGMRPIVDPKRTEDRWVMFPNPREFDQRYLDTRDDLRLRNVDALTARLAGIFSYYAGVQPMDILMPMLFEHRVEVEMTEHQMRMHEEARKLERALEKKASQEYRKNGAGSKRGFQTALGLKAPSIYRIYSRQMCNFALPPEIPRPLPKGAAIDLRHGRDAELTGEELQMDADLYTQLPEDGGKMTRAYELKLQATLQALEQKADTYLRKDLAKYSPKFARLIELLETSAGPAYVYTQFREMEGVRILSSALKAHGYLPYGWRDPDYPSPQSVMEPLPHTRDARTNKRWDECTAVERKTFQPLTYLVWPRSVKGKERAYLLQAFNRHDNRFGHRIKVFLSTKAGAEGISLMNVRQVHILEPYWNEAILEQAIGRSRRLCSHAALPLADRRVDVYRYCSTFPAGKRSREDLDRNTGKPLTTDQYVEKVARMKKQLVRDMMSVIRNAAVDCSLNRAHNQLEAGVDPIRCLSYPNPSSDPAYKLNLDSDALTMAAKSETREEVVRLRTLRIQGREVRIAETDIPLLQTGGVPVSPEKREVDLYHLVDPRVIGRVVIVRGKKKVEWTQDGVPESRGQRRRP